MVIIAFALMYFLAFLGVDVTVFIASMGILGLVIAFAAQDTLSNFIAGMMLLADRPFEAGDLLLLEDGSYCEVKHVGLRTTRLYNTFDHDMVIMPNNLIANGRVVNLSRPDRQIKVKIVVGVAYGSDTEKVQSVLMDIALKHPDVVHEGENAPWVRFIEFSASALEFKLYCWVEDLDLQWRVASELRSTIHKRFAEEGISIPFPQRDIHIKEGKHLGDVRV